MIDTSVTCPRRSSASQPAARSRAARLGAWLERWLWTTDLDFARTGRQRYVLIGFTLVCLGWLTFGTYVAVVEHLGGKHHFFLFGVAPIERVSMHAGTIGRTLTLLAWTSIVLARVLLVLDISFYRRITGSPFHWETLLNITMVSVLTLNVMLPISLYLGLTTILLWPVELYRGLIDRVPTLFHMSALPALLSACFIQDLCFYWSHRWGHKIRFFWYLGHIAHHRVRCVSTFTVARDSIFPILQVAGPNGASKLVLVPVIVKLLTLDYSDAMWGFVAVMVVDLLLDYSHSPVLWHLKKTLPRCAGPAGSSSRRGCASSTMQVSRSSTCPTDATSPRGSPSSIASSGPTRSRRSTWWQQACSIREPTTVARR